MHHRPIAARSAPSARPWLAALVAILTVVSLTVPASAGSARPSPVAAVQVTHRDGQTFITWPERTDLSGERYRVFRWVPPIGPDGPAESDRIGVVGESSATLWSERQGRGLSWRWRFLRRAVIADRAAPLPAGTGLFVWTPSRAELGADGTGRARYAVVVVDAQGRASAPTVSPRVTEKDVPPRPVLAETHDRGRIRVYLAFMDLHAWNPTFHAPHRRNKWLGFDRDTPGVRYALSYAHTYTVATPDPAACPGGRLPARMPVIVRLHGKGGWRTTPVLRATDRWCAIEIEPTDAGDTYWFGFAVDLDYRRARVPGAGDRVANFTEARVLRMVYDLFRDPELGGRVDRDRVYVYGGSMGGLGVLSMAMRYPDVFAAAYANSPFPDYATAPRKRAANVVPRWGRVADDLPVVIDGPGRWAQHLERYEGTGVWTWQNHNRGTVRRRGEDSVPLGIGAGLQDEAALWSTQGSVFFPRLERSERTYGAGIFDTGHGNHDFVGLPPTLALEGRVPFAGMRAVRDETVPGLTRDSRGPDWPPDGEVFLNNGIAWSASWKSFAGAPVDRPGLWRMALRAVDGVFHRVDVTPRRTQAFRVTPGVRYRYRVLDLGTGEVRREGRVTADEDGLVTVPGVPVMPRGVRVEIRAP